MKIKPLKIKDNLPIMANPLDIYTLGLKLNEIIEHLNQAENTKKHVHFRQLKECCKETGAKGCTCICNGVIRATHSGCPIHGSQKKKC